MVSQHIVRDCRHIVRGASWPSTQLLHLDRLKATTTASSAFTCRKGLDEILGALAALSCRKPSVVAKGGGANAAKGGGGKQAAAKKKAKGGGGKAAAKGKQAAKGKAAAAKGKSPKGKAAAKGKQAAKIQKPDAEAGKFKTSLRHRIHSAAYHSEKAAAKRAGCDPIECKRRARIAAQKAVADMQDGADM